MIEFNVLTVQRSWKPSQKKESLISQAHFVKHSIQVEHRSQFRSEPVVIAQRFVRWQKCDWDWIIDTLMKHSRQINYKPIQQGGAQLS